MMEWFRRKHKHKYEPFYDEHSDYNTNAKSYYDYLSRFNEHIRYMTEFINRLMNRNLKTKNTPSISFIKKGDWIDNGGCEPDDYDDEIELSANVIISKETVNHTITINGNVSSHTLRNSTSIKTDGVWSPDYLPLIGELVSEIDKLYNEIGNLKKEINDIKNQNTTLVNRITTLEKGLQKIVNNLSTSGTINNNNIDTFVFNTNRNIASGNINLFGGSSDGNSFIKTSNDKKENDITAGY